MATKDVNVPYGAYELEVWDPTPEEVRRRELIYNRLDTCRVLKNQTNPYFSELTFVQMIDQAVKNAVSYAPSPAEADWRMRLNMPETEDSLQNLLSYVAAQRLRSQVYARDDKSLPSKALSRALSAINDYVEDANDGDMLTVLAAQEMMTKGTVFIFEGYDYKKRTIKNIESVDFETGKTVYKEEEIIDVDKPTKRVVPVEAMFIPNWYQIDLQKQPYIMEIEILSYDDAATFYGHYKNWKCVPKGSQLSTQYQRLFYFYHRWGDNIADNEVQVVHYYDRQNDIHNIVINGVLITDVDNPIEFAHKNYPYSYSVCQRYASNFFFGRPFPMRMFNRQEFLNALMMMVGDRGFLSIMPWFITNMQDGIQLDDIGPLQRVTVADVNQFREANIKPLQQGDVSIIQMMLDSMNRSAPNPYQATQQSSSTATAILAAQQSALQTNSMLLRFMMWLEHHAMEQRISNILQFYAVPDEEKNSSNMVKKIPREIRLKDQQLSDGSVGELVIRITQTRKQFLTPEEKDALLQRQEPEDPPVEYIEVTVKQLRNVNYEVIIIPDSSVADNKPLRRAQLLEAMDKYFGYFGQSMDQAAIDYWQQKFAEEYDLDIDKLRPQQQQLPQGMPGMPPEGPMPQGPPPGTNGQITQQILGNPEQSLTQLAGPSMQ